MPVRIGCGDGLAGDARKAIEKDALLRLIKAGESLSLRVHQRQLGSKLPEHGNRGRLIVDEDAAFAGGKNFAPQNDLRAFRIDAVLFQDGFCARRGLVDASDNGLISAVADHIRGALAPHQKRQRIHENGFSRAGLAGKQIQAGAEYGDGVIDDRVVLGAQFDEHGSVPG